MTRGSRLPPAVAGADAGEEPPLLVAERLQALPLDFLEEFVHPALLGLALFDLALGLAGGAALEPPLQRVRLPAAGRGRGVALQAGIALREVVPEWRVLAPRLQDDELL